MMVIVHPGNELSFKQLFVEALIESMQWGFEHSEYRLFLSFGAAEVSLHTYAWQM